MHKHLHSGVATVVGISLAISINAATAQPPGMQRGQGAIMSLRCASDESFILHSVSEVIRESHFVPEEEDNPAAPVGNQLQDSEAGTSSAREALAKYLRDDGYHGMSPAAFDRVAERDRGGPAEHAAVQFAFTRSGGRRANAIAEEIGGRWFVTEFSACNQDLVEASS